MEPAGLEDEPMDRCNFTFNHEKLDVYRLSVEAARRIRRAKWPRPRGPRLERCLTALATASRRLSRR